MLVCVCVCGGGGGGGGGGGVYGVGGGGGGGGGVHTWKVSSLAIVRLLCGRQREGHVHGGRYMFMGGGTCMFTCQNWHNLTKNYISRSLLSTASAHQGYMVNPAKDNVLSSKFCLLHVHCHLWRVSWGQA